MKKILLALISFTAFAGSYPNNCKVQNVVENTLVGATVPTLLAAQRDSRRCLVLANKGASTVYITYDATPGVSNGIPLAAGAMWDQNNVTVDNVYAHTLIGTTTTLILVEGK